MFVCAINRHILEEMTLVCCGSQCLLLCVNCGLLIRQETFWVESFLSCPYSCENEASCCYNPFGHLFLPVSQGLQTKRLKELHCRHSKETVALFAKDADGWPEKTRLELWAVAPKKMGRELSEKEDE